MKLLYGLVLAVLVGCSTSLSLDELEQEALATGDWSAVEKREKVIARSRGDAGPQCPSGSVKSCYEFGMKSECLCLKRGGH